MCNRGRIYLARFVADICKEFAQSTRLAVVHCTARIYLWPYRLKFREVCSNLEPPQLGS